MAVGTTLIVNLVSTIIIVFINAFALWLSAEKILKYAEKGFKIAVIVAAYAGLVSFVLSLIPTFSPALVGNIAINLVFLIINAVVLFLLISKFYELPMGKAAIIWLLVLVIGFILGFVLGNIMGFLAPTLGI